MTTESENEYLAYRAQELARDPSIPLAKIFDSLKRYDQSVVDTRNAQTIQKRKKTKKV